MPFLAVRAKIGVGASANPLLPSRRREESIDTNMVVIGQPKVLDIYHTCDAAVAFTSC